MQEFADTSPIFVRNGNMEKYTGPAIYHNHDESKETGNKRQYKSKYEINRPKQVLPSNLNRGTAYHSRGFHPRTFPPSRTKNNLEDLRAKYQFLSRQLKKANDDFILFQDENLANHGSLETIDLSKPLVTFEVIKEAENAKPSDSKRSNKVSVEEKAQIPATEDSEEQVVVFEPHENNEKKVEKQVSDAKVGVVDTSYEKVAEEKQSIVESNSSVAVTPTSSLKPPVLKSKQVELKNSGYQKPTLNLLPAPVQNDAQGVETWVNGQATKLDETLKAFRVDAQVINWTIGPSVVQFEVKLGRGVKVSKITNLADDLQLALAVRDVRIEAPIPGKSSVGIEIPNRYVRPVNLSEVIGSQVFRDAKSPLTVALGVDLFGKPQVTDLQKMPHGLIAGATGSGKSVFINSMLVSLLYKASPAEVKLILIDPKAVEMAPYQDIPHLLAPVISDAQAAAAALKWVVTEMEQRYERLVAAGVRNIEGYNAKVEQSGQYSLKLPYIVVVIDELADLMLVASSEVQDYIARITAKARAAGIHLIVATQRPSVDVVTGTIKNNIPTRIAFMVSSQVDSRTIIDTAGAEKLLGRGDMLYLGNGSSQPVRLQGTYIGDEIDQITDFVRGQGKPKYAFDPDNLKKKINESEKQDKLFPRILDYIVNEESISTSKLQREFSIGFNRAAGIIDQLEAKQYISKSNGSKPRRVFLTQEGLNKLRQQG